MKFFVDNDISPRFAKMLKALDEDVVALRDEYPPDTKDSIFLRDLRGGKFDVLISNNTEQRKIPQEKRLLKEAGIISLYFNPFWSDLGFWDQAIWLLKNWRKIRGFCEGCAKGTCADLQQNGTARVFHL